MGTVVTRSAAGLLLAGLVAGIPIAAQQRAGAPPKAVGARASTPAPWPDAKGMAERKKDAENRRLFRSQDVLAFTLTSDFRAIDRDRDPLSTKTYPGTITFEQADGTTVTKPVQVRGRGHSRRNPKICDFSPLRVEFKKEEMAGTVFAGHTWLKLGTHCRSNAVFEQYVLREYTAYRIFNLVTPHSFRARLTRPTYVESATQKPIATRFGMFIEDDDDVAKRMEGRITEQRSLWFRHLDMDYLTLMTLFEYLLGNTDVSIFSQHNVRVVETPAGKRYPVPYDFDYSGLVNTTYATFDKTLFRINSVRDRVWRGPCRTMEELEPGFARFRAVKNDVLALYDGQPNFTDASRQDAKNYIERFYRTLDSPNEAKRAFVDACLKEGYM
jgi:hypothetical protein